MRSYIADDDLEAPGANKKRKIQVRTFMKPQHDDVNV
jgi:hypothetical protein